jgi:hypothetical protein
MQPWSVYTCTSLRLQETKTKSTFMNWILKCHPEQQPAMIYGFILPSMITKYKESLVLYIIHGNSRKK